MRFQVSGVRILTVARLVDLDLTDSRGIQCMVRRLSVMQKTVVPSREEIHIHKGIFTFSDFWPESLPSPADIMFLSVCSSSRV